MLVLGKIRIAVLNRSIIESVKTHKRYRIQGESYSVLEYKGEIMELQDFTEKEQEQIKQGLSEAVISDKEAGKKILDLVPEEWIKRIPFFVKGHATTKTIDRIAKEYPELYAVAKREGALPEKEREELRKIITDIFEEKMKKHKIQ